MHTSTRRHVCKQAGQLQLCFCSNTFLLRQVAARTTPTVSLPWPLMVMHMMVTAAQGQDGPERRATPHARETPTVPRTNPISSLHNRYLSITSSGVCLCMELPKPSREGHHALATTKPPRHHLTTLAMLADASHQKWPCMCVSSSLAKSLTHGCRVTKQQTM